jgi:predicted DNA-binding transcriptional regulator YafY
VSSTNLTPASSTRPAVRCHAHPSGAIVPTVVTAEYLGADLCNISYVREVFDAANGFRVAYDTFRAVLEAVCDGGAVVVLYTHGTQVDARVLFPTSVSLTKSDEIVCTAFCTLRRETKTFRLDRMVQCHALTLPGEVARS